MMRKQLNVWLPEELRKHVERRAKEEECGMNQIVADLIREDIARQSNEFVERGLLTALQEMIRREVHQASAQLRFDVRTDCEQFVESSFGNLSDQYDWLGDLLLSSARNVRIVRRLMYVSLVRTYGLNAANEVYDEAKERAQQVAGYKKRKRSIYRK